jgi:hypothetical protein
MRKSIVQKMALAGVWGQVLELPGSEFNDRFAHLQFVWHIYTLALEDVFIHGCFLRCPLIRSLRRLEARRRIK